MKTTIAIIGLTLTALASSGQVLLTDAVIQGASFSGVATNGTGGSCTVTNGDLLNESFEGTAGAGWTATGTSPAWGDAMPANSPCDGLGSKTLGCVTTGANVASYGYDLGSYSEATRFWRFYFFTDTNSLPTTDAVIIFAEGEGGVSVPYPQSAVYLFNTDSVYQLVLGAYSLTNSAPITVSLRTWYRVEIQTIYQGLCTMKVFDATGTQVGNVTVTETASNTSRYVALGCVKKDEAYDVTVHIDGFGASTLEWLGQ